jgi:enoyl-CoA hydratase/carnithine racemase
MLRGDRVSTVRIEKPRPHTLPDAQLLEAALDPADTINGWGTRGVALTKRILWAGLETASPDAAIELESHTQLCVRLTTRNFEEVERARKQGRKLDLKD